MSRFDDDQDMEPTWDERLLAGDLAQDEPELTAVISAVRAAAAAPAPPPSPALLQLLRDGVPESTGPQSEIVDELTTRRRLRDRRGVRRGFRIAVVTVAAAVVATGAAALDPMPEAIREPARALVTGFTETFTPWSGPHWSDDVEPGKRIRESGVAPADGNGDGGGSNDDAPADGGSTGGGSSGEEQGPVQDGQGTTPGQQGSSDGSGEPGQGAGDPADPGTSGSPAEQGPSPDPGQDGRAGDPAGQSGTVGESGVLGEAFATAVSAPSPDPYRAPAVGR